MAYRSWAITYRPTNGISDDEIDVLTKWMGKADFHYAVIHAHGQQRHMHASIWLPNATTRSNLINRILSIKGIHLTGPEKNVLTKKDGIKIQWDSNFIGNYMLTHDDPRVVSEKLPEPTFEQNLVSPILEGYYPEPDDQRAKREFKGSPWYLNMEKKWHEMPPQQITEESVGIFVHHHMFVARTIQVIEDPRKLAQKISALVKFLWKTDIVPRARFNPY